jgi:hypothetical protein
MSFSMRSPSRMPASNRPATISLCIVDVHFEFYFRKFQQELRQQRADYYYGGDPRHAQSQRADRLVPERIDSLDGVVDAVQNRLRID